MNDTTSSEPLRLDGNAAAGLLSEIFASEPTVALSTCAGCGATAMMGALLVYAHAMGTVMRCPACDGVVLRVARTRTQLWLDASGARCIVLPTSPVV
jgi:Family of unknown function (DUF6510)